MLSTTAYKEIKSAAARDHSMSMWPHFPGLERSAWAETTAGLVLAPATGLAQATLPRALLGPPAPGHPGIPPLGNLGASLDHLM